MIEIISNGIVGELSPLTYLVANVQGAPGTVGGGRLIDGA